MLNKETKRYEPLLKLIPTGKENGVSRRELSEKLGLDARSISDLVLSARRDNIIIASGNRGYYFPADLKEEHEYYKRLHSMALTILGTLTPVRRRLIEAGIKVK